MTAVHPVTPERLGDLAELFGSNNATNGCWCMVFVIPRKEAQAGWNNGGNCARFEEMTRSQGLPMGLIAYRDGRAVGWCAVGPRKRYSTATSPRSQIMSHRDPREDEDVWLVPCFFVRVGERKRGTTAELLDAAVSFARAHGAKAIEGWPLAGEDKSSDGYLGREHVFEACGFECIARPSPRRAVMRRELKQRRSSAKRVT